MSWYLLFQIDRPLVHRSIPGMLIFLDATWVEGCGRD